MAGNKEGDDQRSHINGISGAPEPPVLGCLTQTLVKSPVIKYMIPARIRHQKYNDVIFVYSNYIEIKQVITEGHLEDLSVELRDVAFKSDFDSTIRAARIFGSSRKITASVQKPTGIEAIIKKEELPPPDNADDYHPGIPPQILVLSLESKKLVFLFAFHNASGAVHFVCRQRALPSAAAYNEQVGEYIAVDPKSRAMAVAAWEGWLTIYSLKPMKRLKEEVEVDEKLIGNRFEPVKNERNLQIQGTILKMEFLHPQRGDDDHIILLLVVSKEGKTSLVWYSWDLSETDLPHPNTIPHRQRFSQEDQLPLLLIPLTMSSAFVLISEAQITVYKDILHGIPTVYKQRTLDNLEPPEEPGSSKRAPLWTQWARPMRGEHWSNNQDDVYLCREDGLVRYVRISDERPMMIDSSHRAGILKVNVNTAFTSIDLGVHHTDLLAVGGDLSNGGLWIFPPRHHPKMKAVIPNWTPLIEYTTTRNSSKLQTNYGRPVQAYDPSVTHTRTFACTGKGTRHGAISEMRYGLAAFGSTCDVGDLSEGGILRIWALARPSDAGNYLMLAHPTTSSLWLIATNEDGNGPELGQLGENLGISLDARTIAAGVTASGLIIQVTENSINAVSPEERLPQFETRCHKEKIAAASIGRIQTNESVLLTVVRDDQGFHLHYGYFRSDFSQITFEQLGDPVLLSNEPSCISIHEIWHQLFAFIATTAGRILVYCADVGSSLTLIYEYAFEGEVPICDSIAVLTLSKDRVHTTEHIIVCGLRNGTLQTLCLNGLNTSDSLLTFCETIFIGDTSVHVATDKTRANRAIAVCEQQMFSIEYPSTFSRKAPATMSKVYFTSNDLPAFQPSSIILDTQTDPTGLGDFSDGTFYFLSGTQLHMAHLQQAPQLLPHHLPVDGTPSKVLYSKYLKKLIALYTKIKIIQPRQSNGHYVRAPQRALRPMIAFLDPDSEPVKYDPDDIDHQGSRVLGECNPGEKVLGMMEWFPLENDGKMYPLLVLNTLAKQYGQNASGRLLMFAIRQGTNGEITLDMKINLEFESPVYSVAAYGRSSLVYCCGKDLILRKLVMHPSKRWNEPARYSLTSPAAHISVHASDVYVTTTNSSLSILKIEDDKIVSHFNDQVARAGLHHLEVSNMSLILASGRDCTVTGLWKPPKPRIDNSTCTLFQVRLPGSITRFRYILKAGWHRASPIASLSRVSDTRRPSPKFKSSIPDSHNDLIDQNRLIKEGEAIIGVRADGAIHQFDVLDEPSWRLLRYIQNMAMLDPIVCPFHEQFRPRSLEPVMSNKRNMHVDGDILHQLLERGGEDLLGDILDRDGEDYSADIMDIDFISGDHEGERLANAKKASARRARFKELAADVAELADGERDEAAVVQWIRFKLLRAL